MAVQLLHLSSADYVALRSLYPSNPARTKCGWSKDKQLATKLKLTLIDVFTLRFHSSSGDNAPAPGFQLEYSTIDVSYWDQNSGACGGTFSTPNGILTSPSYPDNYPYSADCAYTISQPTGSIILLTFHSMDIEEDTWCPTCSCDYLEIRDGSSAASPLLGKLCGSNIPAPILSSQNQVWMKWGQTVCK